MKKWIGARSVPKWNLPITLAVTDPRIKRINRIMETVNNLETEINRMIYLRSTKVFYYIVSLERFSK